MSLKTIFLAVVGTLALLAAIATGLLAVERWAAYQRANRIVVQDLLLADSAAGWARERGALATALAATSQDSAKLVADARAGRSSSDGSFYRAIASLRENSPSRYLSTLISQAETAHSRVVALREHVDAALSLPAEKRPIRLVEVWIASVTNLIERSQLLCLTADRNANIDVASVRDLQMLRHQAWLVAENAGRERATIGAMISAGAPIDPRAAEQLAINRGKILQTWTLVRFFAGTSSGAEGIGQAIRSANDIYFGDFSARREAIVEEGRLGAGYSVSAEAWFDQTTSAIDSLLAVERASTEAEIAAVDRAFADALRRTLMQGALFIVGVALAAGLFLLMSRRIVDPINRMTKSIIRLADGDVDAPIPALRGGDEIAGMAKAMRVFRENAVARARLEVDLLDARDRAEAASRAKTEFLANMSHELRTPLNAVIGFAELIEMEVLGPLGQPQYRGYVHDIHESGRHLLELVNNILDMSRIEVGSLQLEKSDVAIGGIVDECRQIIEAQAATAQLDLAIQVEKALPEIRVDAARIRQVLLNLLSNAVKFTPKGGKVECIVARDDGGDLVVEVADTGIGMTPEEIAIALEPFRQVDNTLARRYEGAGLGLALSRGLAELHGGRIEIDSERGKGTRARLVLPATCVAADVGVSYAEAAADDASYGESAQLRRLTQTRHR